MNEKNLDKYRNRLIQKKVYGERCNKHTGCFSIPYNGYELHCIISEQQQGNLHISISRDDRVFPLNEDICYIRELLFDDGDILIQYYSNKKRR